MVTIVCGLAQRAKIGGSSRKSRSHNRLAAMRAGGILSAIHLELQLKITGMAAGAEEVGDSGAAGIDGLL